VTGPNQSTDRWWARQKRREKDPASMWRQKGPLSHDALCASSHRPGRGRNHFPKFREKSCFAGKPPLFNTIAANYTAKEGPRFNIYSGNRAKEAEEESHRKDAFRRSPTPETWLFYIVLPFGRGAWRREEKKENAIPILLSSIAKWKRVVRHFITGLRREKKERRKRRESASSFHARK